MTALLEEPAFLKAASTLRLGAGGSIMESSSPSSSLMTTGEFSIFTSSRIINLKAFFERTAVASATPCSFSAFIFSAARAFVLSSAFRSRLASAIAHSRARSARSLLLFFASLSFWRRLASCSSRSYWMHSRCSFSVLRFFRRLLPYPVWGERDSLLMSWFTIRFFL